MRISNGRNPSGLVAVKGQRISTGSNRTGEPAASCGSLSPYEVIKRVECDRYAACLQKDKKAVNISRRPLVNHIQ